MTPLQLALTSNEEMDEYLEFNTSQEIRHDILTYSNTDRTIIATAAMAAWIGADGIGNSDASDEGMAERAVKCADALISKLNKQS